MFKLVKIEGSGTNQPEPVRIATISTIHYKRGHAYAVYDSLLMEASKADLPTHIAIESAAPGEKDELLCYRIQNNMVFEVPVCGGSAYFNIGKKFDLAVDSCGGAYGISNTEQNGKLMVNKSAGQKRIGETVYVRVTSEAGL